MASSQFSGNAKPGGASESVDSDVFTFMTVALIAPLIVWVVRAIQYAKLRANSVRMSPTQFPEGYQMVVEAAQKFGLRKVPDAYVVLGNGVVNAFASGHGYRRFVAVHSDVFEIGGKARDPETLRFVIGHEVGHIAAGHTSYFRLVFTVVGSKIPLFGSTVSRAQEYTADNYGYYFAPQGAPGVIGLLSAGKYLGEQVNFHAFADRAATERGLWLHIQSWMASHPINIWRAHALRDRSKHGRLIVAPRRETAQFAPLLPAASDKTPVWPTPDQASELGQRVGPATSEEQFGRYPGRRYELPADALRLASPNPQS
ncbi:MAG: M48 family metallopeptidase [Actinomycetaceae bacterium]|nr:M48 family metallopeptidase [Actinomycetaceae bacterium]